ncbi:acyl-CoA N-acyltransferase [Lophium mytilinum]|uniref:Acyl-CoA N-acyltransferase n=1 Tax=Lophium mytilinum TaxID=390894 RepID=A0A6A6QNZ0_9PEZI|nr:acyl-CoA N-acyltransferase [Lophium mytilinum]
MAQKAEFIKIPPAPSGLPQTTPTEPERRLPSSDISISEATVEDLPRIVEGFYASFPPQFWERKEPLALRPPTEAIRHERFIRRLLPTFSNPNVHWIIAKHVPTNAIMGVAGWTAPGAPIHNFFRRSAVDFFGWRSQYACSDAEYDALWSVLNKEAWEDQFTKDDETRKQVLGDEPHWYLAPLFTFPEWQGRGVGKLLLSWAIEQADKTEPVTPLYLESTPTARAVYMHCGFVPQGDWNFVRRGPAVVRGLEAEEGRGEGKAASVSVDAVAVEKEAAVAE